MPKIPLYNKGTGTAVDLATGSLSRQASVQAFTAPGRALESFANNAQQIAFNFGQAEKKAQGDAASSDIQSQFLDEANTLILESPTSNTNTAKAEVQSLVNTYKNKLKTNYPNLTNSQIRNISNQIESLGTRASVKHREESFRRGRIIESNNNNKLITKIKDTVKTLSIDNPIRIQNIENVRALYFASQRNGSNKGFTYPTFESFERAVLSDDVFTKVNNGDIEGAKNLVNTSKLLQPEQKFKLNKQLTLQTQTKQNENYNQSLEKLIGVEITSSDSNIMKQNVENNKTFTQELSSGESITLSPETLGTANKIKLLSAIDKIAEETSDKNVDAAINISNATTFTNNKNFLFETQEALGDLSTEEAQKAINISASNATEEAKQLLSRYKTDYSIKPEQIAEKIDKARYLIRTNIRGNSIINTAKYNKKSNQNLAQLVEIENDFIKSKVSAKKILDGVKAFKDGTFDEVKDLYTSEEQKKVTAASLAGATEAEQIKRLQLNAGFFKPFKDTLDGGVSQMQGAFTENIVQDLTPKVLLYQKLKSAGETVLNAHVDKSGREVYEAILANNRLGFNIEESITRVSQAWQQSDPLDIPRQAIAESVRLVKSELEGFFDTEITNISTIETLADSYMTFLTRYGIDRREAVNITVDAIENSSININGYLLPKYTNYPNDFENKTNLIVEEFKKNNPDYEDDKMALRPLSGRADIYDLYANTQPVGLILRYTTKQGKQEETRVKTRFTKDEINELAENIVKKKNIEKFRENQKQEKLKQKQDAIEGSLNISERLRENL